MKKLIVVSFALAAILVACTKKAVPSNGSTSPERSETAKTTETKTTDTKTAPSKTEAEIKADMEAKAKAEETAKQPAAPATSPIVTEMDNGKSLYVTKCTSCHAMKNTGDYSFFQWQNILRSMVPKAKLNSEQEKQLTAYIKANAKQ